MKPIGIVIIVLIVFVIVYLYMIQQRAKEYAAIKPITNVNNYNSGYELGLALSNLIANTKCGKEGRPPCTKAELEASGWTPEQIAQAEQASLQVEQSLLCFNFGINC